MFNTFAIIISIIIISAISEIIISSPDSVKGCAINCEVTKYRRRANNC